MANAIGALVEQFEADPHADLARDILELCAREELAAPQPVLRWALSVDTWDDLPAPLHDLVAEAVRLRLPQPTSYLGIYECSQGEQRHQVAMFALGGARFALIPGGRFELGWKRVPLEELEETWQQVRDGVGQPHVIEQVLAQVGDDELPDAELPPAQLHEWLDGQLSPLRTVKLDPYLIECNARPTELDYQDSEDDTDEINGAFETERHAELEDQELDDQDPHCLIARQVAEQGFRLPTPDEWEHACSGGSRHFFRWGARWPNHINIYDACDEPELGRRNAFGLLMNANPYHKEVVSSPDQLRGGDGGELVCGGAPDFASWLTAMSSYVLDLRGREFRDIFFEEVLVRRALSVLPPQETDDQQERKEKP